MTKAESEPTAKQAGVSENLKISKYGRRIGRSAYYLTRDLSRELPMRIRGQINLAASGGFADNFPPDLLTEIDQLTADCDGIVVDNMRKTPKK